MLQTKSPTEVGINQERLLRKIILDVLEPCLGIGNLCGLHELKIRERMTWRNGRIWTVNWYRPNTHPTNVGEIHVPDFDFWMDDRRLANLESKNWKQEYRPLSLYNANDKILSRVTGRPVELGNLLIISELRCQEGDEQEIHRLLREHRFKVLLTHRQTDTSDDEEMYHVIRNMLEPILTCMFNSEGPKPDWALFLIEPKSSSLTLLVTLTTHIVSRVDQYYGLREEYGLPIIQSMVLHCMVRYGMPLEDCSWPQTCQLLGGQPVSANLSIWESSEAWAPG